MAASIPVVAFDTEDVRVAIDDGVTGLIVQPSVPAALASAVMRILSDAGLARRLASAARSMVDVRYRIANVAEHLEREYVAALEVATRS